MENKISNREIFKDPNDNVDVLIRGHLKIGDLQIIDKDYADCSWIYRDSGEGMAFDAGALYAIIVKFYKDSF